MLVLNSPSFPTSFFLQFLVILTHSLSHPAINLGQQTVKDVKLIPQLRGENAYMWRRERETEVLFEVELEHQTLHLEQDERLKG